MIIHKCDPYNIYIIYIYIIIIYIIITYVPSAPLFLFSLILFYFNIYIIGIGAKSGKRFLLNNQLEFEKHGIS